MRGTIIKRGGTYSVVLELGRDPATGKRRRQWHSGFRTKKDAERARIDLLSRLQRGDYVDPSQITFGDYLVDKWLPAREPSLRPGTFASYTRNVEHHIAPKLGSVRLQTLQPDMLSTFYADRLRQGGRDGRALSPRTVRYLHSIIRKSLADALRWGLVIRNVADAAEPPADRATQAPVPRTWTASEVREFLASVRHDRLRTLWTLIATTGLRRGEALGLRWSDVNMETAVLSVVHTSVTAGYEVHEGIPKTAGGQRAVELDDRTLAELRDHRKRQAAEQLLWGPAYEPAGLVFCKENGAAMHPDQVSKGFSKLVRQWGGPRIPLHGLRHTWATLALEKGVHPKVVSERLGHSDPAFTLRVYSHVRPGMQKQAAEAIASVVLGE